MSGKLTRKMFICAAIAFGSIGYASTAAADASEQEIALCEQAIVNGARGGGIPEPVLHAISLNETGRMRNGRLRPWPWAINREGRGHWFETREQALAFARKSVAEGRHSFDVGCFQINYRWHGQNFVSLESMFDPDVGAAYAAKFLGELHQEKGEWSAAAGAYHSRTQRFANKYRARFDRIFANVSGAPLVVAQAAPVVTPETEPKKPRRSRERMKRKPLIIRLEEKDSSPTRGEVIASARSGPKVTPAQLILTQAEPIVLDW